MTSPNYGLQESRWPFGGQRVCSYQIDEYAPTFAEHLLPFNFTIGVSGGVDVIIKTVQLAVDQYIIEPEQNGDLPSRGLVSLDIRNMFNANDFPFQNHMLISSTMEPAKLSLDSKMANGSLSLLTKDSHKDAQHHQSLQQQYFMTYYPKSNLNLKHTRPTAKRMEIVAMMDWDLWGS